MGNVTVVTGGTGFVGAVVVCRLVSAGHRVRVLVRSGNPRRLLTGLPTEIADGDLADATSLQRCLQGCRLLFHVAAIYSLWARDRRLFYEVNVEGTRRILLGAAEAGVGRVAAPVLLAPWGSAKTGPRHGRNPVGLADMVGNCKRSKFLAEQVACELAREGLPVVVNPSTPVGPGAIKPTPTGRMILDFLRGKMWGYVDTGLNLVDVDDVAAGHLLVAEPGRVGERHILSGRNLTLREIFEILGRITGKRPPRVKVPAAAILPIARLSEWITDHLTGQPPFVAVDAVRMARKRMFFDLAKAVRDLGMPQSPVENALAGAVRWFRTEGYAPAA